MCQTELENGLAVEWVVVEPLSQSGDRAGEVAALSLIKGECVGILSRFGLDPVGPEAPAGGLGLIGGPGDDAEVVSRAGHAWVELECGAQRLHGVGGSARPGQQESEVEERRGVVRLDLQGPAEARLGAVGLVQVLYASEALMSGPTTRGSSCVAVSNSLTAWAKERRFRWGRVSELLNSTRGTTEQSFGDAPLPGIN